MATVFQVTYEDGVVADVRVKPRHILTVERTGGSLDATIEASYKLAWLASQSTDSFEDWLDGVEDIEPLEVDGEDVEERPTSDG